MARKLETRIEIDAPLSKVWAILDSFERYEEWNEDVWFHGRPSVGSSTPMSVRLMGKVMKVPVHFEALDAEKEVRWRGGPKGMMTGTHYLRLRALTENRTELIHGEDFAGLALPLLWPLLRGELLAFYERINAALKARAEHGASL